MTVNFMTLLVLLVPLKFVFPPVVLLKVDLKKDKTRGDDIIVRYSYPDQLKSVDIRLYLFIAEPKTDHSPPPRDEFKIKWSFTSTPTFVFVV